MQAGADDADLASEFAAISKTLFSSTDVAGTMTRIAQVAVASIEPCRGASIFLTQDEQLRSAAATDALVTRIDELQRATGEGPCLDCLHGSVALEVADDL